MNKNFDLRTTLLIAMQIIRMLEKLHNSKLIHRDIKPDNFLIGKKYGTKDTIFMIDFGLAKCYMNNDLSHIQWRDGK